MAKIKSKGPLWSGLFERQSVFTVLHIVIFLTALGLRLGFVLQFYWHPLFEILPVDTREFSEQARTIVQGNWLDPDTVFVNPLYPLILALHFQVFGTSYLPVIFNQAVLDSLSCLLAAHICSQLFGRKAGLITAAAYACCGPAVFYTGVLLTPTLLTFTLLCLLAILLHAGRHPHWLWFAGAGLLFAVLLLAAPNLLLFMAAVPVWLWFRLKDSYGMDAVARWFAMFAVGTCTVLCLMALRNHEISGRWIPFPAHGGINFYMGNHPGAEGYFMQLPDISGMPVEQVKTSIRVAETAVGKALSPVEASRYWFAEGITFWANHPVEAMAVFVKKTAMFWRREELPLNVSYDFTRQHLSVLRLSFVGFGLMAPLGLMGMLLSIRSREALLLLLFLLTHTVAVAMFFVSARYRFPATPVLAIYAGAFTAKLLTPSADGDWSVKVRHMIAAALLIFWVNYPFAAFTYLPVDKFAYEYGTLLYRKNHHAQAQRVLAEVVAQNPAHLAAHFRLGQVYEKQKRYRDAAAAFSEVARLDPDYPGILQRIDRLRRRGQAVESP